jgi:hypothetical protein
MSVEKIIIKEIHLSFELPPEFFERQESMTITDFMPGMHEFANKMHGSISEPGIYCLELRLVRLK